jgi:hypothetical protein
MNTNLDKITNDIADVQIDFLKNYGYIPNVFELNSLYTQGELLLTDSQEDSLIQWFEVSNLR